MIYENSSLKCILVDGRYIEGDEYHFYLQDHLGNNRVVEKADGTVVQTNHYYLYGMSFADGAFADKQPYKYNGKELDRENVTDSDPLFVIDDADGESARGITSMMGGKVAAISSQYYANDNWFSNTFSSNNARTIVYKFEHAAGLTHEIASGQNNLLKQYGSGTNVTSNQRVTMWKNQILINNSPNLCP